MSSEIVLVSLQEGEGGNSFGLSLIILVSDKI